MRVGPPAQGPADADASMLFKYTTHIWCVHAHPGLFRRILDVEILESVRFKSYKDKYGSHRQGINFVVLEN